MKRQAFAALAALLLSGVFATEAAAAPPTTPPPGSGVSQGNTDCAGHGGFRTLGTNGSGALHDIGINNLGSNGRPGASSWMFPGDVTTGGANNSLCGGGNVPPPFAP